MKKIILVAAILVLGFSGISNATVIWFDDTDVWFGNGGAQAEWIIKTDPVTFADLSIFFKDDKGMLSDFDLLPEEAKISLDGVVKDGHFSWLGKYGEKEFQAIGSLADGYLLLVVRSNIGDFTVDRVEVSVPEPTTMLLLGLGLVGLAGFGRKRFNS